jgi:hypothetical protein
MKGRIRGGADEGKDKRMKGRIRGGADEGKDKRRSR